MGGYRKEIFIYKINLDSNPYIYDNLERYKELDKKQKLNAFLDERDNFWFQIRKANQKWTLVKYFLPEKQLQIYEDKIGGLEFEEVTLVDILGNGNLILKSEKGLIEYNPVKDQSVLRKIEGYKFRRGIPIFSKSIANFSDSIIYTHPYLINTNSWKIEVNLEGARLISKIKNGEFWIIKNNKAAKLYLNNSRLDTLIPFKDIPQKNRPWYMYEDTQGNFLELL